MPLPADVPTFTLVCEFPPMSPDGTERQGTLTFTPIPGILPSPNAIYLGVENTTLNATGGATKELIARDAFTDPFAWRVDADVDGVLSSVNISVPASAGTVHLGAVAEYEVLPPDYYVIPGPRGPEGPAGTGGGGGGAPSGPAGGVLAGLYPNPSLNPTTIASFDAAGAAATAQSAAISTAAADATSKASAAQAAAIFTAAADATSKANAAQSAATSAAAADATSKVAAHEADTTGVHGITDTSALVFTSDTRLTNPRTPTTHAASHAAAGSDPVTPAAIGAFAQTAADTLAGRVSAVETVTTDLNTLVTDAETRVAGVETRATALESGRLEKASNLSDVASAATARTNLGLGSAATQASGAFDAAGAAAAALVDAKAYTDAHSGGSGSAARSAQVRIKVENITLPNTGGWAVVATSPGTSSVPLLASIDAAAGDRIWADVTFMRTGSGTYLDLAMLNSDGSTIAEFAASGTATAPDEGAPEFYPQSGSFPASTGTVEFVVGAGQISGGKVKIAQVYKGAGSGTETLYASAGYPWRLLLRNAGPQPA